MGLKTERGSRPCRLLAAPPPRRMLPWSSSVRRSHGSSRPIAQVRVPCLCCGNASMPLSAFLALMGLIGEHAMAELRRKALLERLELELDLQVVDIVCAWASYTDRHQTRVVALRSSVPVGPGVLLTLWVCRNHSEDCACCFCASACLPSSSLRPGSRARRPSDWVTAHSPPISTALLSCADSTP